MVFTVLVLALAVCVGYLAGGRLHRIGQTRLRVVWVVPVALAVQALAERLAVADVIDPTLVVPTTLSSLLLIAVFALANRERPGLWLVLAGSAANAVVIGANEAMPVSPEAIDSIGYQVPSDLGPGYALATEATQLRLLADIIPIPPLRSVVSIGDLVLAVGLVWTVAVLMRGGTQTTTTADLNDEA